MNFKKFGMSALAIALLAGCSSSTPASEDKDDKHIEDLKIEFVPSKDADVILTGVAGLDQMIIDSMGTRGYTID